MSVEYEVKALAGLVVDKANPLHRSDDRLFPDIPDFQRQEPQENVKVSWGGYFWASCDARQVFGKDRLVLSTYMGQLSDGEDVAYLYPPSPGTPNSYKLDKKRALKVNRKDYEDRISGSRLSIDNRVEIQEHDKNGEGILGITLGNDFNAADFTIGVHQIVCEVDTKQGLKYKASTQIEIFDDRG